MPHDEISREEFEHFRQQMRAVLYGDEKGVGLVHTAMHHKQAIYGDKTINKSGLLQRVEIMEHRDLWRTGWMAGAAAVGGIVGGALVKYVL